ncbi:unnamed protein product [Calypogeia fissa]
MASKREMARLYSLANDLHELRIPSMDLFRPWREWVSSGEEKANLGTEDMNFTFEEIVMKKRFEYVQREGSRGEDVVEIIGLWVLPAFANHSCAPNCQHSFVGDTLFFRASSNILEGEELTVPYFHDLFDDVEARQAYCETFEFTCKCDRCRFEESLRPQLSKMRHVYPELLNSVMARIHAKGQKRKRSFGKEFSSSVDEVEALIQSLGTTLLPRQQDWIRATFIANYVSKMYSDLLLDSPSKVASLRVLIDAIISVGMTHSSGSGPGCQFAMECEIELQRG